MGTVHFGCRVETGLAEYETCAQLAQAAEAAGYDSIWIRDHVAIPETTGDPNCLEVFTTLAGLARDTKRVQLGTLVVCTPWRNPALVAKMSATIDVMSNGRLILGLGAGSQGLIKEFQRYGWECPPNKDRIAALGEQIQIIRKMWSEDAPTFHGKYHRIEEAVCDPKPKQRPMPKIIVGASGEQLSLKNVARHADGWESAAQLDEYLRKTAIVNQYCEQVGRDPRTLIRAMHQVVIIDKPERARARAAAMAEHTPNRPNRADRTIIGEPEQVAASIKPYLDAGVQWFITFFWEKDTGAQRDNIAAFGSEVMPILRQMGA